MASGRDKVLQLLQEERELGREEGRAEAQAEFYGEAATVLLAELFADSHAAAANRIRPHNPEAAAMMEQIEHALRRFATPARVTNVSPSAGTTGVALDESVVITFEGALDMTTVTDDSAYIYPASGGAHLNATLDWNAQSRTLTIIPENPLAPDTSYRVTVEGSVRAEGGQVMRQDYSWTFATGAE